MWAKYLRTSLPGATIGDVAHRGENSGDSVDEVTVATTVTSLERPATLAPGILLDAPLEIPEALAWAHPLVAEWFVRRFGTPTEPQEQGWPHILAGRTTLISAPTGSGKTLSAFLACIDRLVRKALSGELCDRTEVLYVSPLKALGNDIQKNLEGPLGEIQAMAGERGLLMSEIRTAVRTGDTLMAERRLMLKRPPHILVTTPESLYILLTAEKSRAVLRTVETVIVDEIHAVADDKRGSHLSLSLERLDALVTGMGDGANAGLLLPHPRPVRIGLSATQKPIEEVAAFLCGAHETDSDNAPVIVNIGHRRQLDVAVEVPGSELGPVASNIMWDEIYDRLAELVREHRSTIVFVNTRRLAERIALHLAQRLGEANVAAHHGSLSRKLRFDAESKLKKGEVAVLVATASLELGIDVGTIDLVCQINSPRAIAVALQRVGRAGHWRGAIPKGRLFATTRDDLIECAALVRAIQQGDLDRLMIPDCPLDVLAQQIVAMCAVGEWREDDMYAVVRRAHPYRNLTREKFERVLEMLSEGIASKRGRYGAYLHRDRINGVLRARRGSRMAAIMSGGAIPETGLFNVVAEPDGQIIGTLDEDFAIDSSAGDIMLLGNTSWLIRAIDTKNGRVRVEDAHGAAPNVPFWRGEAPGRTRELSAYVGEVRQQISDRLQGIAPMPSHTFSRANPQANPKIAATVEWLKTECGLDDSGAEQAIAYILEGRAVLGDVPTQTTIIAERFFDEGGGMQLIIHAPFGGRVNKAWGLALRKRFCRGFNFELQAAATDNGLNIALAEQHSFPLDDVFRFLHPDTVNDLLQQAALPSPIFKTRWKWDAQRALALQRFSGGKKVPPQIMRMRSDDLLASVFPDVQACPENHVGDIEIPDHPLIEEVMKDVMTEAMDIHGLEEVLRGMVSGTIRCIAVDTPVPSQFSHEILNANPYAYLDDAPLEERRARAVQMRRTLPASILEEVGQLDGSAIAQVQQEAWPDVRDADELHDALHTLIALPEDLAREASPWVKCDAISEEWDTARDWSAWLERLIAQGRVAVAEDRRAGPPRRFWVATERLRQFRKLYPDATFATLPADLPGEPVSREDATLALLQGWLGHSGPVSCEKLGALLGLPTEYLDQAMLRQEMTGAVLRGKFTDTRIEARSENVEWCERRLLARIHRLTIGALRKQVEPVTAANFMHWLLRWQHVAPGSQMAGARGLLEVLRQLQGFEIPANAWERQILGRRVRDYDPAMLDQLCLAGTAGWGRLSPHPATVDQGGKSSQASHGSQSSQLSQTTASAQPSENRRRVIPTSVAPITFFLRAESDWMAPRHPASESAEAGCLSPSARAVMDLLKQRGASFFADIVRGTQKLKAEVESALWELAAAGLVTADGFDNLRSLIDPKRRSGQGTIKAPRPRNTAGRWALLYVDEVPDKQRALEACCWMLLHRYGVVFRDLLTRESSVPKWRELRLAFRRLEDRGEVRGGSFVDGIGGFGGEQFALPGAVESLRASRREAPSGVAITISAADPLNLVGILIPGERVPAISGRTVSYRDGVAVPSNPHPIDAQISPEDLAASEAG